MDDEFEPSPELGEESPSGFESLPPQTQAEIKKLRQEHKSLRERNQKLQHEVLTTRFREDVLEIVTSAGLTDFERQVELAEKLQAKLTGGSEAPATPETAPEPPSEERLAAEAAISAATQTPTTATSGTPVSAEDIMEFVRGGNTAEAERLAGRRYGNR